MNEYRTIFEVGRYSFFKSFFSNLSLLTGFMLFVLAIACGVLVFHLVRRLKCYEKAKKVYKIDFLFLYAPVSFLFIWQCLLFFSFVSGGASPKLVELYETGQCNAIEGMVHLLYEQPYYGHSEGDLIEINGQKLEVNHFIQGAQYRTTIAYGGVLKEGVLARVWYCDFCPVSSGCSYPSIARVDVMMTSG